MIKLSKFKEGFYLIYIQGRFYNFVIPLFLALLSSNKLQEIQGYKLHLN